MACILKQFSGQFRAPADTRRRTHPAQALFPVMCGAAPTRARPQRKLPHQTAQQPTTFATHSKRETMKTSFSKKQLGLAVTCALALSFVSGATFAQSGAPEADQRQIWGDSAKDAVWKNPYGLCWRSAYGPPPAYGDCNPAPVAQAAPPAPVAPIVVAAAPPQAVYQKVSFDANVLFDFDKSVLRPAGRATLDNFVSEIQGIGSATISAVGFADRFGTDGYNQALSERRVATVKAYLDSKGVESTWAVKTSAVGESQPTTTPGQCTGATATAGTIACLQPDRHVHVEISGSRLQK
jgi:OOP family OmpA-OmpF porin